MNRACAFGQTGFRTGSDDVKRARRCGRVSSKKLIQKNNL